MSSPKKPAGTWASLIKQGKKQLGVSGRLNSSKESISKKAQYCDFLGFPEYNRLLMKWPERLTLIRHDTSAFNALREKKNASRLYQNFRKSFEKNLESEECRSLAYEVMDAFILKAGDHDTPLAEKAGWQAKKVGEELRKLIKLPDVIFVSPYVRTKITLEKLIEGWPELREVQVKEEERIREQDHGLALIYNDWRVFEAIHPDQRILRNMQGGYWYRFPQGENVPDVRGRLHEWLGALIRDYSEKNVMAVTHHLTILSLRANLERLDAKEFERLDHEEKPINAGVTIYRGEPDQGGNGRLVLEAYNLNLYSDRNFQTS